MIKLSFTKVLLALWCNWHWQR